MKKYLPFLLTALLIASVALNIFLVATKEPAATPVNIEAENPIDDYFFNEHFPNQGGSAIEYRMGAANYKNAWAAEMNHAYDRLEDRAHADMKLRIRESKSLFTAFAENEIYLGMAPLSDAYGNEIGEYGESIHYGTGAPGMGSEVAAALYKKRTLEIFEYLSYISEPISFIFDKDTFLETLEASEAAPASEQATASDE